MMSRSWRIKVLVLLIVEGWLPAEGEIGERQVSERDNIFGRVHVVDDVRGSTCPPVS
jgi:hypothetical protein